MAKKEDITQPIPASFDEVVQAMVGNDPQSSEANSGNDDLAELVSATHKGILPIGGLQLECYVLEAVSYTHLDVYKRQFIRSTRS